MAGSGFAKQGEAFINKFVLARQCHVRLGFAWRGAVMRSLARQSGVWRSRVMRGFVRFGGARQGKAFINKFVQARLGEVTHCKAALGDVWHGKVLRGKV